MTTSILSPFAGDLTGYDLQVIKDFAIEAPWEWRRALEALVEEVENLRVDVELAEDAQGEAEGRFKRLRVDVELAEDAQGEAEGRFKRLKQEVELFLAAVDKALLPEDLSPDVTAAKKSMEDLLEEDE